MKLRYLLPVAFLVAVFSANYVYASVPSSVNYKTTPPVNKTSSKVSVTNNSSQAISSKAKNTNVVTHSAVGMQQACLVHKNNIKKRDSQMYNLSNNIINRFSVITSNVESYYNRTVIPKGIVIINYSSLLNTVLNAQDTAQGQLNQFNLDYANFSCTSANPQAQVLAFNSDMKIEINDLNLYKTAVVNLLFAVKSAVGTIPSTNTSSK